MTLRFGWILVVAAAAVPSQAATSPALSSMAPWMLTDPMSGSSAARSASSGYLGVDVRDVAQDEIGTLKLKDAHGAEIVLVDHDAPAGKAGLREHDVVLQMNGHAVENRDQIRRMLHDSPPGKTITLLISRDGQQMTISTQMSTREEVDREAWEHHLLPQENDDDADAGATAASSPAPAVHEGNSFLGSMLPSSSYTGAMLEKMPAQLASYFGARSGHGLLVSSVKPNSPAADAGIQAGDVILRANSKVVTSTGDWAKVIKSNHGRSVAVVVLRDKKEQTLTLTPDAHKHSGLDFPVFHLEQAPAAIAHIGLSWLPGS
ncbi:MAG TPA: PDZ domain-containing protein [Acidobacteriaceae bacterium]|nr:PDZ domain-containing protein [Acidobacteriaceae bacterium]